MYISDVNRLEQDMGQFQIWHSKLFYYHSDRLGWRFLRGIK